MRSEQIEQSRTARQHFFTTKNLTLLREKYQSMTEKQREEIEQVRDIDSVAWFNRTKVNKRDATDIKTIPGSFYKAREQGCVTMVDSEEITKLYKRGLVTCCALLAHSLFFIQWLYASQIISKNQFPRAYKQLPYVVYPSVLFGGIVYIVRKNSKLHEQLDSKYTPIWLRVSQKTLLDDDEDEDDD